MQITKDTKWRLIEWGVYVVCALVGIAIIAFALTALVVTWKYTNHGFFWWTIPQGIVSIIVVMCGFAIATAPHVLARVDKKFTYNK